MNSPSPVTPPAPVTIAGYRVVRKLGEGPRAEVFLAGSEGFTVALKVYRSDAAQDSIDAELQALARSDLQHRVRLLDVGTGDNGLPVAVLERVPGGSLGQLLRRRNGLEPGEAVTIIAPLARLTAALHVAGIAHRALGVESVHFGDSGQPVLLGFGRSMVFPVGLPPAGLDLQPGALADRERLASLASLVVESVRPAARAAALDRIADWLSARQTPLGEDFALQLEERLFDTAEAIPVGLISAPGALLAPAGMVMVPSRTIPTSPAAEPRETRRHGATRVHRSGRARGVKPEIIARALGAAPLAGARGRVVASVRSVRRPLWWTAGGVAAALCAALILVPSDGSTPAPSEDASGFPSAALTRSSASPRAEETSTEETDTEATNIDAAGSDEVRGHDPGAALVALLTARARCFDELSQTCLDAVDQPDSSALADDAALLGGAVRTSARVPPATAKAGQVTVLDRQGDSAVVRFGLKRQPAAVLMIRNEAGWRIRSYLEP